MKLAFITFGDGELDFHNARRRIVDQAIKTGIFSSVIGLNNKELCNVSLDYSKFQKKLREVADYPLFYRATKAFLMASAQHGEFGKFDAICYADPGCEFISNSVAKRQFFRYAQLALETGGYAEQLEAEEWKYSKKYFLDETKATLMERESGQIQATFSILKMGPRQRQFSDEWVAWSEPKLNYWQSPEGHENEVEGFIDHRNDQSIFSILWKRENFSKNQVSRNFSGIKTDFLRGATEPLHTIRNRTGRTVVPQFYNMEFVGEIGRGVSVIRNKFPK